MTDKDWHQKETPSKPKRGRPTEIKREITKASQSGLREGLTRATFIVKEDTLDRLKERAYTDRKKLKDLVTEAIDYYLDNAWLDWAEQNKKKRGWFYRLRRKLSPNSYCPKCNGKLDYSYIGYRYDRGYCHGCGWRSDARGDQVR